MFLSFASFRYGYFFGSQNFIPFSHFSLTRPPTQAPNSLYCISESFLCLSYSANVIVVTLVMLLTQFLDLLLLPEHFMFDIKFVECVHNAMLFEIPVYVIFPATTQRRPMFVPFNMLIYLFRAIYNIYVDIELCWLSHSSICRIFN